MATARWPRLLAPEAEAAAPTVVSLGSFDGVHRGHQALIAAARELAGERGLELVVVTFDPHPAVVLRGPGGRFEITPRPLKLAILGALGVDAVSVIRFDRRLAAVPAGEFLERELAGRLKAAAVVVGYNFTFGAGGRGTVHTLREWAAPRGVLVRVMDPVMRVDGQVISSSWIRTRVSEGNLQAAAGALGRPLVVEGAVVAGDGRGSEIGFPTANVAVADLQLMPPYGVYAGFAVVGGAPVGAVANWGVRPTVAAAGAPAVLEVHLLDFAGNLRGQRLRFAFGAKLREERRFPSLAALVTQIRADVERARAWWANAQPEQVAAVVGLPSEDR